MIRNDGRSPHDISVDAQLTDDQRTLIEDAVEAGYFEVPRKTTIVDLEAEHDLSDREVSRRLRRGVDVLLRRQLE